MKVDETEKSIISEFRDIAKLDSFEDALSWLAGSNFYFREPTEAIDNAVDLLFGGTSDYFTTLIRLKAKTISGEDNG